MPLATTKSKLVIFIKVSDLGSIFKDFISSVCMPNMKSLSLTFQKLWLTLKFFATEIHTDSDLIKVYKKYII